MKKINVPYSEVWKKFIEQEDGTELELASNCENGISILMYVGETHPTICVECDDVTLDEAECTSSGECEETVKYFYDVFLDGSVTEIAKRITGVDDDEEESLFDPKAEIDERELELENASDDFVHTIAPNAIDFTDDYDRLLDEVVEVVCEYLYNNYNLSVYRPIFLEDKDGKVFFTKYPYDEKSIK